jgi:SPP1 gp7 family putative phage head morphogenesis protein
MPLPPARLRRQKPDYDAWIKLSREMAEEMHNTVWTQPEGAALRSFLDTQTELITSLPLQAAQEVQAMALNVLTGDESANKIIEAIESLRLVTKARATEIARTEVGRTSAGLTQVRAESIGSPGYIWRTARDGNVRPIHRRLEGKLIRWDKPPIAAANGTRAHAGCIYNCRCWAEVIVPSFEDISRFKAEAV